MKKVCYNIQVAYRGIAQLVEYRSPKPWVAGSNPPAPAKHKSPLPKGRGLFCLVGVSMEDSKGRGSE